MKNPIIILGSSKSFGKTRKAIEEIIDKIEIPVIDLKELNIGPYDYEHHNSNDDYIPLMEKVIEHDLLVLATPIYWYSMSAVMKIFIDRLSDLLDIRKDIGYKLRGKKLFVIASFNTSLPKGFEDCFEQICNYMGMKYEGCSFICSGNNLELNKKNRSQIIKARNVMFLPESTF
jgi:multimeric flavodoxin WrbA